MPTERTTAETEYLKAIYDLAKTEADKQTPMGLGRVMVEVTLPDVEREAFEQRLGYFLSKTTTVSWDLQPSEQKLAKSRIISLQQETYFHAHLIGRMVAEAIGPSAPSKKIQDGVNNALKKLNQGIAEIQKKALARSTKQKQVNVERLNEELDKARVDLLPFIAKVVREELIKSTHIQFTEEQTNKLKKELAEKTSASIHDIVHVDEGLGMVSFIEASRYTSHDKQVGDDKVASRRLYSHQLNEGGTIAPLSERLHVRVPSIAVKGNIDDAAAKILNLQAKYRLGEDGRETKAFVYNLYTTLNDKGVSGRIDERSNKQTQSAKCILMAAHQYNRDNPTKPFCLVQNIPVNGRGHELDMKSSDPVVREAALMAQLAMLHTVYDVLNVTDRAKVEQLFENYSDFLKSGNNEVYFYDYCFKDRLLLEALTALKREGPDRLIPDTFNFMTTAKRALVAFFKEDAFAHHDHGFTYQALSVFVEKSSIGGCKSGNERAQAVNGRVAVLDFVSMTKETRDALLNKHLSLTEANRLIQHADALEQGLKEKNIIKIRENLDELYQSLNIEGFQALVSFADQGGHSKLEKKEWGNPNTNKAETVETHAKNASKWQCHKGLIEQVQKEFCGIELFHLGKELAKGLGLIAKGALGGASIALTLGGAIAVAGLLGASIALPPLGIAIGIAIGITMGTTAFLAATKAVTDMVHRYFNSKPKATEARFKALQAENTTIIEQQQQKAAGMIKTAWLHRKKAKKPNQDPGVAENPGPVLPPSGPQIH